jgi:quinoprotein glucose dehydrogenase
MRLLGFLLLVSIGCSTPPKEYKTWKAYNGSAEAIKYSTLTQIDTSNVAQLQVAWTYHTGDADTLNGSQIQCNPIIVDGTLYGVGPQMKLFAIDATPEKRNGFLMPTHKPTSMQTEWPFTL